jgi:uncharacterized protein YndB with AHSA1/START domain
VAQVRIHARAAAPLETVWSVLADQTRMPAWTPARTVTLEREGDVSKDGVGAIRVVSRPPFRMREQITEVQEPTRLAYRLLSGLPVREYHGETVLSSGNAGTDVVWTVTMIPRLPGVTFVVRHVIGALVNGLVAEAERRTRHEEPTP